MKLPPLEERYENLVITREGRLLTITMNRPDALNAADALLHEELADVFYDVANDEESDVVVLTGAGRAFSAGGDIDWMQTAIDRPHTFEKTIREAKRIVFSMLDLEKPLIAKVNGHATGLGATLALVCDVIFAADSAKIGDPHVSVGLVAGDGGAAIWPQLIGYARAKEYLLSGELMPATKAAEPGRINQGDPREQGRRQPGTQAHLPRGHGRQRRLRGHVQPDLGPPGGGQRLPGEAQARLHRRLNPTGPSRAGEAWLKGRPASRMAVARVSRSPRTGC